nr:alpha/beta hydrolase domain-containing protein [Parafrankia elaeagni]
MLVRRPAKAADFSGTVVVEWLNVSGGVDADVEWGAFREEILRQGHAWVGVSAQRIGVVGGPVLVPVTEGASLAGRGLVAIDPARYGSLRHPGDGFSFDILTQVGRAVRAGTGLGGPRPRAFDGFFVHSRGASGLPLVGPEEHADLIKALGGTPTVFRTDQDAPVLDVQTESDLTGLLSSHRARQPDNARLRLWEVAGTAHVDTRLLGAAAARIDCGVPINSGPLHLVAKAGLRALAAWATTGTPPATAPRIEVTADGEPSVQRDADRIAVGGVRTPPVEIPVTVLSGEAGPTPSAICQLAGSNRPLPAGRLAERYPSRNEYQKRYNEATESAVSSGFLLSEDRPAMLAMADSSLIVA